MNAGLLGLTTLDDVVTARVFWKNCGLRVAFTNGVFDLIHPGHIATLRFARSLADKLIVGINSDDSVRRLKGDKRPLLAADERAKILASLDVVDLVVEFAQDDPALLIDAVRPDVLVKGGDYGLDQIVGRCEVEGWGGIVRTVPLVEGRSTSDLVQAVLQKAS